MRETATKNAKRSVKQFATFMAEQPNFRRFALFIRAHLTNPPLIFIDSTCFKILRGVQN